MEPSDFNNPRYISSSSFNVNRDGGSKNKSANQAGGSYYTDDGHNYERLCFSSSAHGQVLGDNSHPETKEVCGSEENEQNIDSNNHHSTDQDYETASSEVDAEDYLTPTSDSIPRRAMSFEAVPPDRGMGVRLPVRSNTTQPRSGGLSRARGFQSVINEGFRKDTSQQTRLLPPMPTEAAQTRGQEIKHSYEVTVLETEVAVHCGLVGKCMLEVSQTSLSLRRIRSEKCYTWQFSRIRRFSEPQKHYFEFEGGRGTASGPGVVQMKTKKSKDILGKCHTFALLGR